MTAPTTQSLTARRITAVIREVFPGISPLTTSTDLSPNGLVLGFTITMPVTSARHWGLLAGQWTPASEYLSCHLGTPVHITDVYLTRRRDGSKLAHLIIQRGEA